MTQQIKELRIKIDGLYQLTNKLQPLPTKGSVVGKWNSQEIEESVKSLLLAKAWLGKLLGELGDSNPYSTGKKTVEDIEPTADVNNEVPFGDKIGDTPFRNKSHIEKVDWLRGEIQEVIDEINSPEILHNIDNGLYWNYTYKHLCEAKMWLGLELGRVRDESK